MSDSAFLHVDGVSRYFPVTSGIFGRHAGVVKAVDDVSFTVEQGESLALVGESGCGKTTLARLLLKLLEPTTGAVSLGGKVVSSMKGDELKQFRMDVQAVFQDPWASLSPRMRVFDIIAETLVINQKLTQGELQHRVHEALAAVGLKSAHARLYPHEFSGGQRQRIAIASAIIAKPKLIILDEPVSALDVSIRSQIMNLFKDLQQEFGCSYVIVAHDLGTTRYMADRIAVMYLGKLVEVGPTEMMFTAPEHPYTQALLSAALPLRANGTHSPIILNGEVPSPTNPPSGCPFHPRCQSVQGDVCQDTVPLRRRTLTDSHYICCHKDCE